MQMYTEYALSWAYGTSYKGPLAARRCCSLVATMARWMPYAVLGSATAGRGMFCYHCPPSLHPAGPHPPRLPTLEYPFAPTHPWAGGVASGTLEAQLEIDAPASEYSGGGRVLVDLRAVHVMMLTVDDPNE
uniref:Uncharacterized protein n=1 Tax=Anopheles merus TaxID=30066 RepID=A0A182V8J7_ANOME